MLFLLVGCSIGWAALEAYIALASQKINQNAMDRNTGRFLAISTFVLVCYFLEAINLVSHGASLGVLSLVTAVALVSTGILVRLAAFLSIRGSFNLYTTVSENASLKTDGLFRLIRHPSYLGSLLIFLGYTVFFLQDLFPVALFGFQAWIYLERIKEEEHFLTQKFGATYVEYSKRTKKLLPLLF